MRRGPVALSRASHESATGMICVQRWCCSIILKIWCFSVHEDSIAKLATDQSPDIPRSLDTGGILSGHTGRDARPLFPAQCRLVACSSSLVGGRLYVVPTGTSCLASIETDLLSAETLGTCRCRPFGLCTGLRHSAGSPVLADFRCDGLSDQTWV